MTDSLRTRFWLLLLGFCVLVIGASAITLIGAYIPNLATLQPLLGQATGEEEMRTRFLLAGHTIIILSACLLAWWGYCCFRDLQAHTAKRMRELATAFELSREMTAEGDNEPLFDSVTTRARALMSASSAVLCLVDEDQRSVYLAAGTGACYAPEGLRQPISRHLPSRVVHGGDTVASSTTCAGCLFLQNMPDSQVVATPLRVRDTTLGALCVVRPEKAQFDTEEQNAFALLGNAAAVALMNVRRMEQSRIQTEEAATHNERARLAAELHDNLAQTLGFLNFKTDQLSLHLSEHALSDDRRLADAEHELGQMRDAVTKAYLQVRTALTDLRGSVHSDTTSQSLENRLTACIEELRCTTGMPIALDMPEPLAFDLPAVTQNQIVHIVREALVNAWRHAQASYVTVTVDEVLGQARFTVSDDGRGFDPAQVDAKTHLGLGIMRSRAERSGGRLSIESSPGDGTRIVATFSIGASARKMRNIQEGEQPTRSDSSLQTTNGAL